MKEQHIVLIDQVGRTIIGKKVGETETTLSVFNPVILHVQPQQNGQLEVQTFPLFFFEFIDKTAREFNTWTYSKESIVTSDVTLNPDIVTQYQKINTPIAPPVTNPKVISVNDI